MKYDQCIIATRIKTERKAAKLSMERLAELINVNRNTMTAWERQDESGRIPPLDDLLQMCELFQCELGYLLGEYDCKTRVDTDIKAETGLIEPTIRYLRYLKKNSQYQTLGVINSLLCQTSSDSHMFQYSILSSIEDYLTKELPPGTAQILFESDDKDWEVQTREIEDLILFKIQYSLKELKEAMMKVNYGKRRYK